MKVLELNSVFGIRSTGRICAGIADLLQEKGDECKVGYGRCEVPEQYAHIAVPVGGKLDTALHGLSARLFDNAGFGSKIATRKFLKWVDTYKPDIIHLHNIHGYYLDVEALFSYLKEKDIPVVWTLHDCWAYTGHCSHFASVGCEKWKTQCEQCPLRRAYPSSWLLDNSHKNYCRKKQLFSGVKNMQIVTPSEWLSGCVQQSFLSAFPVHTIQNGIDLETFCPRESDFAHRYGLENKKIVLGVASAWSEHKGLSAFYRLADLLGEEYQVVLVGLEPQQIKKLPGNVLGIHRTNNAQQLAQLYSAAYVHVSMSREETMGMTLIEANACATPVIAFDSTALPEIVTEETGIVVKTFTAQAVAEAIMENDFSKEKYGQACIAHAQKFEKKKMYLKYIELYRSMVK